MLVRVMVTQLGQLPRMLVQSVSGEERQQGPVFSCVWKTAMQRCIIVEDKHVPLLQAQCHPTDVRKT